MAKATTQTVLPTEIPDEKLNKVSGGREPPKTVVPDTRVPPQGRTPNIPEPNVRVPHAD